MNNTIQETTQPQPQENSPQEQTMPDAKMSQSRIKFFEVIMVVIFLAFAIPLYLFIIKTKTKQVKTTTNPGKVTLQITPAVTPFPISIKSIQDIDKAEKDLDILDARSFDGTIVQYDILIGSLTK